jgi:hypothetical protein
MPPIFDLTRAVLAPLLETAVEHNMLKFKVAMPPDIQPPPSGYADTRVGAFSYTTASGRRLIILLGEGKSKCSALN